MKKTLLASLLLAALAVDSIHALDNTNGIAPAIGARGGTVQGGATLQLGVNPGAQASWSLPLTTAVNVTKGDALILVAGRKVSLTATVGDVNFIGFAGETTAFGLPVQVVRAGICLARIGTSTVAGDRLVMSANSGFLTPSAAVTAANYTSVSGTPWVARALETTTYSASIPTVLVVVNAQ